MRNNKCFDWQHPKHPRQYLVNGIPRRVNTIEVNNFKVRASSPYPSPKVEITGIMSHCDTGRNLIFVIWPVKTGFRHTNDPFLLEGYFGSFFEFPINSSTSKLLCHCKIGKDNDQYINGKVHLDLLWMHLDEVRWR